MDAVLQFQWDWKVVPCLILAVVQDEMYSFYQSWLEKMDMYMGWI